MQRRQFLSRALLGLSGRLAAAAHDGRHAPAPAANAPAAKIDKVVKTEDEWRKLLTPAQFNVLRKEGTEPAVHEPAQQREAQGDVRLRRLRAAALRVADQIRQRHRMAELLPEHRRPGRDLGGPQAHPSAHRVSLRPVRRPSRSRLRRRSRSRPAFATATTALR